MRTAPNHCVGVEPDQQQGPAIGDEGTDHQQAQAPQAVSLASASPQPGFQPWQGPRIHAGQP